MKDRISHIWKMIKYTNRLEKGLLLSGIVAKTLDAISPFIFLIISRELIQAVGGGQTYSLLFKKIVILLTIYFLLSIIGSFSKHRSEAYTKNFIRKHQMEKARYLLEIDYQWTEANQTQNMLAELYNMEGKNVFGLRPFIKYINNSIGGSLGIITAFILGHKIFLTGADFKLMAEWSFDLLFIILFAIIFYLTLKMVGYINRSFSQALTGETVENGRYLKAYNNIIFNYKPGKDIRLYHEKTLNKYSRIYRDYMEDIHTVLSNVFTKTVPVSDFMSNLSSGIVYFYVAIKAFYGAIDISEVLLFIGVFTSLIQLGVDLVDGLTCLKASHVYREKLFDYYKIASEDKEERESYLPVDRKEILGFSIRDLSFAYPDSEEKVLKNISFDIRKGERLAIVGMNGSGKTSLIKLLTGLYDDYSGEILMDGKDIRNFEKESYQEIFSPVFQDFKLLSLSLKDNLAAFNPISEEELEEIMFKVGMEKFYNKHKGDVYLTKEFDPSGIEISGGEAQKLALARAIFKDGQVFILDEPTAALDPISEYEIYKKFKEITHGKTTIFISHRLSSCSFCDNIIVIDQGRLVQVGSHDQLVKEEDGKYYQLWNAQAKYYKNFKEQEA